MNRRPLDPQSRALPTELLPPQCPGIYPVALEPSRKPSLDATPAQHQCNAHEMPKVCEYR